jgi:hypothetical protein
LAGRGTRYQVAASHFAGVWQVGGARRASYAEFRRASKELAQITEGLKAQTEDAARRASEAIGQLGVTPSDVMNETIHEGEWCCALGYYKWCIQRVDFWPLGIMNDAIRGASFRLRGANFRPSDLLRRVAAPIGTGTEGTLRAFLAPWQRRRGQGTHDGPLPLLGLARGKKYRRGV